MSEITAPPGPGPTVKVTLGARVAEFLEGTHLFQDPDNEGDKADPYAPSALRVWATRERHGGGVRVTATAADVDGLDWLLDRVEAMVMAGFEPPERVAGAKALERIKEARAELTSPPVTVKVDVTGRGQGVVIGKCDGVGFSGLVGRTGNNLRRFYGELTEVDGMDSWAGLSVPGDNVVYAGTYKSVAVELCRRIGWLGQVTVEIDHEPRAR